MREGSSLGPADFQEMGRRALEELVAELPLSARDDREGGAEALRRELVTRVLLEHARAGRFDPEDLGSVYEGTLGFSLELAREDSSVVEVRRKAGQARLEVVIARDAELPKAMISQRMVPRGRYFLRRTGTRRQSGSHYTSRELAERVVELTLAPLLSERTSVDDLLGLRVCDPAMGSGAFLVAACRVLARRFVELSGDGRSEKALSRACSLVAEHCLFGIDQDPMAAETARLALAIAIDDAERGSQRFARRLVLGDSLSDDFSERFAEVLGRGGFDALVGNPPWVSYAGRAAQPLEPELRARYAERFRAFGGYKNLQGLFVERAAEALRPGGRLGFVLPSSMSELAGYAATRRAHDRLCVPDVELPDIGEGGFPGVFQPCMILLSTRRDAPLAETPSLAWALERPDLDPEAHSLLAKLERSPLPPHLFGERGLQSSGEDLEHLAREPDDRHTVPLRAGSDIEAFHLGSASYHADPVWFGGRLRSPDVWQRVRFVIRQTARVPVAALSDGTGFRNSLLAGFEDADYPASFLVAYLNSTPIRWAHYVRHRDARNGMPQMKIAHLRSLPAPPDRGLIDELARAGIEISSRNRGVERSEQEALDERVAEAFELTPRELERLRRWATEIR